MKKNTYTIPLALVFCLFFLWAISSNLLPTMIRQLMKTCELNTFEASFTETAYWLAYFISVYCWRHWVVCSFFRLPC